MTKTLNVFNKINSLRERYYNAVTGKDELIKLLAETEVAEQVYNSNAIENSTLTLEETEKIDPMELFKISGDLELKLHRVVDIGVVSSHNLIYSKEVIYKGQCLFVGNESKKEMID